MENITAVILELRQKVKFMFVPKTLEYLARGGRIARLSKLLGSAIQIKPVITLIDGVINASEKVRTSSRAFAKLISEAEEKASQIKRLAVIEVDCGEEAQRFRDKLQSFYSGNIPIYSVSPVIGAHAGPDAMGIVYHT